MNERIIELAEQAGFENGHQDRYIAVFDRYGNLLSQELEQFAELIVKECAEFVDYRLTNPDGASMAWCDGSDIKKHFGVEE
jgi:hypothetical protein